jgi:Leucine-rich repeat (LRR) protein
MAKLKKLRVFDVQNNQVEYLPEGVRDLPCINSLNVSHNNLNSMKFAVYLKQLEHLHLSNVFGKFSSVRPLLATSSERS